MQLLPPSPSQTLQKRSYEWLRPYAFISCVYFLASWWTRPIYQGDTSDYVASILEHIRGGYYGFWDFGHLMWRPLGWLAYRVSSSLLARFAGPDPRLQITLILTLMSWLAGLASALLLLAILQLFSTRSWIAQLVVTSFVFSTAILNYSRAGAAYIPGLSFLLLAMYLLAREARHPSNNFVTQLCAGLALAASLLLWLPYILAVPAALLLPIAWGPQDKVRFQLSIRTFLFFSLGIGFTYGAVLLYLRLWSAAGVIAWAAASSHGIAIPGISRTIFGWPRSFMNMGDAGRVIKRYLHGDPFHPVSAWDLVHLWPQLLTFVLFYLTLFSIAWNLGRNSRGRRLLVMAAVAAIPVLALAIHWSGGDLERYLPFYPAFFLVLSLSLADLKSPNWTKIIAWSFMFCIVLSNAVGLRSATVRRAQSQSENRVSGLLPRLSDASLVVVSHNLDDLMVFSRNFPFSPVNRTRALSVYPLVTPGNADVADWQERFASHALTVWRAGGNIWISDRLLHATPQTDWNWVEGDVNRVSWSDLGPFFSHLQYGENVGGEDGFVLLLPSTENQNVLGALGSKETVLLPSMVRSPSSRPVRDPANEPARIN